MTDMSVSSRQEAPTLTERQWLRRGELLAAARQVFERDGYHGAAVSSIVQSAGLSQGAFYLYFTDKKAIFLALQEEMAALLRRRIYWATKEIADPRARVLAGLRSYFEYYEEYRDWNRLLLIEGLGVDRAVEINHQELNETLAEGFRPTMLGLGSSTPRAAAFALMGMAAQLAYWSSWHKDASPMSPKSLAQVCAGLFLNGAAATPA
ncbi:MAG: TetR/AcrR family transcriptional regulator [Chloroflexi bacterium]|nr:MAG: TetR/AcrR family transcriptional regulator [Chloroflexota bacterium]